MKELTTFIVKEFNDNTVILYKKANEKEEIKLNKHILPSQVKVGDAIKLNFNLHNSEVEVEE